MIKFLILTLLIFFPGCFNNPGKEVLKSAEQEWKQKRYSSAIEKYKLILEKFPGSEYTSEALLRLGEIHRLNLSQEKEALVYFYRLEKEGEREYKLIAQENIANIYENELHDFDQAIIEYQKLIHKYPNPKYADKSQYQIGQCYFKKADYFQAITEFDILLKNYPDSKLVEDGTFQKINCFYILGDCEKAIIGYKKFLSEYPVGKYSFGAKYSIGNCLEEKEDLAGALAIYKSIEGKGFNKRLLEVKISGLEQRLKKRRR